MGLINAIGEIVASILGGVLQLFVELADVIGKKSHDYKAQFGKKGRVTTNSRNASLYIGTDAIAPHIAMNSTLLIGKTGSGKSTKVYHASLLQTPTPKIEESDPASMSYVVLDPASELGRDTIAYNEERGYQIDMLNFSDASTSTVSWNPIEGLTDSGITRFASEYIETSLRNSKSSDPFWGLSARRVLGFSIRLCGLFGAKYTNLYNARYIVQLLSGDREELDRLLSLPLVPASLFEEYASLVNMGTKLLGSVLATTLASLELFSDPNIARVTSKTRLDMNSFRDQSHILYVQTKVMDQEYVAILNTLLFSSFFSFSMSAIPSNNQNTITFFMDECSSLVGMKPSLMSLASSNLRKHRSFFVGGFQSLSQMEDLYGKQNARTITQNAGSTLFFPNQDLASSREISEMLGRYTYVEEDRKHHRELLTVDEVSFSKHKDGGLLFSGSERGIFLKYIRPFFKNRTLLKRSKIETKEREYIDASMPPLLPIKQLIHTS